MKVLPKKPYVDPAGMSAMIDFLTESDPNVAKIEPEMVINHSILKKLDDSGFIEHPSESKRSAFRFLAAEDLSPPTFAQGCSCAAF